MAEKLCKVCETIPTNHPSGMCVMCMIGERLPPQASQRELQAKEKTKKDSGQAGMTKEGGRMAVPIDRQCKVEGCEKFRVQDGFCLRHFNIRHGIEKCKRRGISEKNPGHLAKEKICIGCKEPYKPTSNAQERCPECKEKHLKEKTKSNKQGSIAEPESKKIIPVIPASSEFCRIRQEEEPVPAIKDDILAFCLRGELDNGNYIISVDFTSYPKLHDKLIQLAEEDFRTPGQQLLSMLHHTLKEAEART